MWLFNENLISKGLLSAVLRLLIVNISAGCGQLEFYLYACSFSNHNLSHQSSFKYLSPSIILVLSQKLTNIPVPAFPVGKYDLNSQMSQCLERVCPRDPRRQQLEDTKHSRSCKAVQLPCKSSREGTDTHPRMHTHTQWETRLGKQNKRVLLLISLFKSWTVYLTALQFK